MHGYEYCFYGVICDHLIFTCFCGVLWSNAIATGYIIV